MKSTRKTAALLAVLVLLQLFALPVLADDEVEDVTSGILEVTDNEIPIPENAAYASPVTDGMSTQDALALYKPVLDMYYTNIRNGWKDVDNEGWDDPCDPDSVAYPVLFKQIELNEVGYAFMDLDYNGIPELLVSTVDSAGEGVILSLYSYSKSNGIMLLSGTSEKFILKLCADNTLLLFIRVGAPHHIWAHYCVDETMTQLCFLEAVSEYANPESYYYTQDESAYFDASMMQPISQSTFNTFVNSFQVTPFDITPFSQYPFTDISTSDSYYNAVMWAYMNGIVKGTTATTFSPKADCTRGQFALMLYRLAGKPDVSGLPNPFKDVKKSDSYYKAILWAYNEGIIKGTSATTFNPSGSVTRGQIVLMLYRMAGKPTVTNTTNPFTDVSKSDACYKAVLWAVEQGITKGTSATTFSPNKNCTRYQLVTFLYRFNDLMQYI